MTNLHLPPPSNTPEGIKFWYRVKTMSPSFRGRLSELSNVLNTDFGRMKGRNRRILLINTCLCFRVLKWNYDVVHCLKVHHWCCEFLILVCFALVMNYFPVFCLHLPMTVLINFQRIVPTIYISTSRTEHMLVSDAKPNSQKEKHMATTAKGQKFRHTTYIHGYYIFIHC